MHCESCQATAVKVRNQNHHHCQTCNTFQFSTSIETAEDSIVPAGNLTEFQCPKCEIALEVGKLRGMVDVCFCNNCRGFVIDGETLGEIVSELRGSYEGKDDQPRPIDPSEMEDRSPCPACGDLMDAYPYYGPGNVIIDGCMHCKLTWFDQGELARIVRAPGVRPNSTSGGNMRSKFLEGQFDKQVYASSIRNQESAAEELIKTFVYNGI